MMFCSNVRCVHQMNVVYILQSFDIMTQKDCMYCICKRTGMNTFALFKIIS